jgi:predicted PurR-regulated permease PerM
VTTPRAQAGAKVLVALTVAAVLLCLAFAYPFLPAITFAAALAILVLPVHEWISRRLSWQGVAAGLTVLLVTAAIAVPAVAIVRLVGKQAAQTLGEVTEATKDGKWREQVARSPMLASALATVERQVDIGAELSKASENVAKGAATAGGHTFDLVLQLLVMVFLLFHFLRDRVELMKGVRKYLPLTAPEATKLFATVRDAIHAVGFGSGVVALVQGVLGGLMFWWLGLPAPLLWGSVMAVLAMLPMLGAAIIWAPAALYLFLTGDWQKGVILVAWGALAVGLVDNLLYPMLVKNKVRLHTAAVFIALLGGLSVFGAPGLILGPVGLVVAAYLLEVWRARLGGAEAEAAPEKAKP